MFPVQGKYKHNMNLPFAFLRIQKSTYTPFFKGQKVDNRLKICLKYNTGI